MKRTFIPPSHRPYVRGSKIQVSDTESICIQLKETEYRRKIIVKALKGEDVPLDMDSSKLKGLMKVMYPNLSE